jgi:hypothetical protein
MFVFEDTGGKSFFGVVFKHWNDPLPNDRATVKSFINEVNSAAGPLDAVLKHLCVHVESGKRRQKARVNIENAVAVRIDEIAGEQAHVAGQTNDFDPMPLKRQNCRPIMLFSRTALAFNCDGRQAACLRRSQTGSICVVANYQSDFSAGDSAFSNGICEREHV